MDRVIRDQCQHQLIATVIETSNLLRQGHHPWHTRSIGDLTDTAHRLKMEGCMARLQWRIKITRSLIDIARRHCKVDNLDLGRLDHPVDRLQTIETWEMVPFLFCIKLTGVRRHYRIGALLMAK